MDDLVMHLNPILCTSKKIFLIQLAFLTVLVSTAQCPSVPASLTATYASFQRNGTTNGTILGLPTSLGSSSVINGARAVNSDTSDYASISASTLVNLGTPFSAYIEIGFANPISKDTTIYIKISSVSGGVLGLFGSGLSAQAYTGASATNDGTPIIANTFIDVLTDLRGNTYLAITPSGASGTYNAVRITASTGTTSILAGISVNVFYAFVGQLGAVLPAPASCSGGAIATSTNISGLASIFGAIANPGQAADGNTSTASQFFSLASVATATTENIYYSNLSAPGDVATLTISVPSTILSAALLNSIFITVYNDNTQVSSTFTLNSLLSAQLLGLLGSGGSVTLSIPTNAPFNRIQVSEGALVGVSVLTPTLNIYEVPQTPSIPMAAGKTICAGLTTTLNATTVNSCSSINFRWYSSSTGTVPVNTANTFTTPALSTSTTYYVAATYSSISGACLSTNESQRLPVIVTVNSNPAPVISYSCLTNSAGTSVLQLVEQQQFETNSPWSWYWTVVSGGGLFYPTQNLTRGVGMLTSTSQGNYISSKGIYQIAVTDVNGCIGFKQQQVDSLTCGSLVLSLNLTNFTVANAGNGVILNWKSTMNNTLFNVERSTEGINWKRIGSVNNPDNIANENYSFIDENPIEGQTNFYRLQCINYDGNIEYSAIRSIDIKNTGTIKIYPNPQQLNGILQIKSSFDITKIIVFDLPGKIMLHKTYNEMPAGLYTLNTNSLSAGIYVICIYTSQGQKKNLKFIKIN